MPITITLAHYGDTPVLQVEGDIDQDILVPPADDPDVRSFDLGMSDGTLLTGEWTIEGDFSWSITQQGSAGVTIDGPKVQVDGPIGWAMADSSLNVAI